MKRLLQEKLSDRSVLWVCGIGFLFAFVINPLLQWLLPDIGAPELPLDVIMELTLAM